MCILKQEPTRFPATQVAVVYLLGLTSQYLQSTSRIWPLLRVSTPHALASPEGRQPATLEGLSQVLSLCWKPTGAPGICAFSAPFGVVSSLAPSCPNSRVFPVWEVLWCLHGNSLPPCVCSNVTSLQLPPPSPSLCSSPFLHSASHRQTF